MIDFQSLRAKFIETTESWTNERWADVDRNPYLMKAPLLEECHLEQCRVVPDRITLLRYLPTGGTVVEVGTQHGFFAEEILNITHPDKLHLIDLDFAPLQRNWERPQKAQYLQLRDAGVVELNPGDSSRVLESFPDEYFNWMYIDAAHDYEGVRRDIEAGARALKPGGLMIFNDYTNWSVVELESYGVTRAVNEFCVTHRWSVSFLALHSLGYYDIAIRKPLPQKDTSRDSIRAFKYSELNFERAEKEFAMTAKSRLRSWLARVRHSF
jgi:predicted O-methyltransferase YrrM